MPLVLAIALGIILAFIALPFLGPILMIAIAIGVIILLFYSVVTSGVMLGAIFKGASDIAKNPEVQKKVAKTKNAAKDIAEKAAENAKVRKAFIAVVAVFVVGFVGITGFREYHSYADVKENAECVIDWIMQESKWTGDAADEKNKEKFAAVKNESYFKSHLHTAIEEAAEVSFYNETLTLTGADGEKRESEYSFSPTEIVERLNLLEYENEAIKTTLSDYWKQYGDLMHQMTGTPLERAQRLESFIETLKKANEAAGDFYQIDREKVYSTADAEAFYTDAIDFYIKAEDKDSLVKILHYATNSATGGKVSLDAKKIISLLTNEKDEIATLQKGIGGYYDKEDSVYAYGDFYYKQGEEKQYSEMTDTWTSLLTGEKVEGNSNKTMRTPDVTAFRGKEIDLDLSDVVDQEFHFAYCQPDGQFIFVSKKEILVVSSDQMNQEKGEDSAYSVKGDFYRVYAEMKEAYLKGPEGKEAKTEVQKAETAEQA